MINPQTKKVMQLNTLIRCDPVHSVNLPNKNNPITIPIFSDTSKKLKKDAVSFVAGISLE